MPIPKSRVFQGGMNVFRKAVGPIKSNFLFIFSANMSLQIDESFFGNPDLINFYSHD